MIIETARLVLRPGAPDDLPALHALFTQPGVRRFLFDDQILSPEQTSSIITLSERLFRTKQCGMWLARPKSERESVAPVGFGAFWYFREPPELELLYGVADTHVKQGYGREIASAVVDYGFNTLRMVEIRASTDAAHVASRRLLEDLGFAVEGQATVGGLDTIFYVRRTAH